MPGWRQFWLIFVGLAGGLAIAAVMLALARVELSALYTEFVVATFSSPEARSEVCV